MKHWVLILWALAAAVGSAAQSFEELSAQADRYYEEGSYRRAHQIYERLPITDLPPAEQRWFLYRKAASLLRSEMAAETADDTQAEQALTALRELTGEEAPRDRAWAEAHEALGDFYWLTQRRHWHEAWPHYEKALEYWAGSTDLKLAAENYLAIVWKSVLPPSGPEPLRYGYSGSSLPIEVLENAVEIARTEEEKARAHFFLALHLQRSGGDWANRRRIPREFEAAIQLEEHTDWYDDALFHYARWMAHNGRAIRGERGNWHFEPDYVKAAELYRRLLNEFRPGETQYLDEARNELRQITAPVIEPSVPHVFVPGAEIAFQLHWRNVEEVTFRLLKVDLSQAVTFESGTDRVREWLDSIDLAAAEPVKEWQYQTKDAGKHIPQNETIRLEEKLDPGAYVLEASGGTAEERELILVTDAAVVLKSTAREALVYFCGAAAGAPIPDAEIVVWTQTRAGRDWITRRHEARTDENGLARFEFANPDSRRLLFAIAKKDSRQAFAQSSNWAGRGARDDWRIYVFTDRPAYRPGETAKWKLTARLSDGDHYRTPSGRKISMAITDPRGAKVHREEIELNSFGSAWGEFELPSEMPLGLYTIAFFDGERTIGHSQLLRLEEYKLPEFKVAVQVPEEDGRKKAFILGETIEIEIAADYYFGAPVANAVVEVIVHQRPYYRLWMPHREFGWFFGNDRQQRSFFRQPGQVVRRETLHTDAQGKATLELETPAYADHDLEFEIEARVTDASRREVTGRETIRVSRQRYYMHIEPGHYLHRPQDEVEVEFNAVDINGNPVAAEGIVTVTRDAWIEIWVSPEGREVTGPDLQRLRARGHFPPPPDPGERNWRLKFQGYQHDPILTRTLETGTNGLATLEFTPERAGFYRVTWRGEDEPAAPGEPAGLPVHAETTIWVADRDTTQLGYRTGAFEIIVDKDSFKAGATAPVMLIAPANDRYALFTMESEELLSYQLVHMTGSVKLLQLEIREEHVPNVFLSGALVSGYKLHRDTEEVIVPPVRHFLTMELTPAQEEYRPGEEGEFELLVTNHEGEPVSAEVALSVVDESVFYIQEDLAGDPREFFYGQKKPSLVQTESSFGYRTYITRAEQVRAEEEREALARTPSGGITSGIADSSQTSLYFSRRRAAAAPAAAPAMEAQTLSLGAVVQQPMQLSKAANASGEAEPAVQVRSDFRTSIFWEPAIHTDDDGKAKVTVTYPDSLTRWKATARAVTRDNQFGIAEAFTRTSKPLIARLQAPRFFVAGDTVTVSAVLNNNTGEEMRVRPEIRVEGIEPPENARRGPVTVPANGDVRVDWILRPRNPGEVKITIIARSGSHEDAMARVYPIHEHGIEKFLAISGKARGEEVTVTLELPSERREGSTSLTVQLAPSLAVTMLDALPYLIHYPYGCTEQTMSRFLPAVITAKTLEDLGLEPEDVMGRVFGGIEPESADKTHPDGKRSLERLEEIVRAGLERLYDFQHEDGGWGWWKEGDSDLFMTGYVFWGLVLASEAGVEVRPAAIARAAQWLERHLIEAEHRPDLQAWMLHALAAQNQDASEFEARAFENLWTQRDRLNAYTRALFALAAHAYGRNQEARTLLRNLENGVQIDRSTGSSVLIKTRNPRQTEIPAAHWGDDGYSWRWSEDNVEATAFALRALLAIEPDHRLVEPVMNWLVKNRRGAQWSNTRDTAIALLALNGYLRQSGELEGGAEYTLEVNGREIVSKTLAPDEILAAPSRFEIPAELIHDGENKIRIIQPEGQAIYFAAQAEFFTLEEPIPPAGNEIFARREYYRLNPEPTLLKGFLLSKQKLETGDAVASGERVEVVITIEAKNDYEYLVFEALKPAGFEAVQVQSGRPLFAYQLEAGALTQDRPAPDEPAVRQEILEEDRTGRTRWVHQELRDRKVALFIGKLPQGFWEIRYELRAEVPGRFHALPVLGHAMYVPEIRCNSAETILEVTPRDPES